MRYPAQDLEPAVRDPKKLRRTAFILVALMVVSGLAVIFAYNRWAAEAAKDDRPAVVGRLDKNFKVWRQDESEAGLLDLAGDVFVIVPVAFSQPESWRQTREILIELAKRYESRSDFHIVCLAVDPEKDSPAELARHAESLGAKLPQWWLAGTREESTHKFLKNRLKASIYPFEKDGVWQYDPSIVLVDRDRHLRKATIRARKASGEWLNQRNHVVMDFEQAAAWDAEGRSEGLDETNVETMRKLLFATIDRLLADPAIEPPPET